MAAAVDYLEIRERLKEGIRKNRKQQNYTGSVFLSSPKLSSDDYGSFFGPSLPSLSQGLIQENNPLLQNPSFSSNAEEINIGVKSSKIKSSDDNIAIPPADVKCSPSMGLEKLSVKLELKKGLKPTKSKAHGLKQFKTAAQRQKYARDYSFLISECADAQKSDSLGTSKVGIMPTVSDSNNNNKRQKPCNWFSSGPLKSSSPVITKKSIDPKKQVGGKGITGPVQSMGHVISKKSVDSKKQVCGKGISGPVQSMGLKGGKPIPSVKPVLSTKQKNVSESLGRTNLKEAQVKKRPRECLDGDDYVDPEVISKMIRGMFGYNPRKYVSDDRDDFSMEANYSDIMKEERRSAKLGKKEDQEELQKIIEEDKKAIKMKKKKLTS